MPIYNCSIDLGVFDLEIEAKDETEAGDKVVIIIKESIDTHEMDIVVYDNQYTDQQELADRERETQRGASLNRGGSLCTAPPRPRYIK